jgi:hypothetical protein
MKADRRNKSNDSPGLLQWTIKNSVKLIKQIIKLFCTKLLKNDILSYAFIRKAHKERSVFPTLSVSYDYNKTAMKGLTLAATTIGTPHRFLASSIGSPPLTSDWILDAATLINL